MTPPRRFRLTFALLGLILIVVATWLILSRKPTKAATVQAIPVAVAKVDVRDIPLAVAALGAAQAWQSVLINTQITGMLSRVPLSEGTDVPKGALLAEIDCRPFRAVLAQAQGTLARDQALLLEATTDLARFDTLAAQDSIAKQTRDDQAALVKQDQGTVRTDQGAVAAAQVNVNYCRITSPVAGRLGVRLTDPGNIVTAGNTTGIVMLNQITPIAVTFSVPQGDFQRLSDASGAFTRPMATEALSQQTGAVLGSGELSIADNRVDPTTGTVAMKARFPNDSKHLWPGQFVNVRLTLQTLPHVPTIPLAAVNRGPKGPFAYVVGADNKVSVQPITLLTTQDATAVIKTGLRPGQSVVVDGQLSLRPGATVSVRTPQPSRQARR